MTTQIQRRRGTTAQHSTFTGAVGEVTVDTDKEVLVVHDGAQVGGYPQMRENGSNSALSLGSAATPSLKFSGDTNTGIYSPGADQVAISTGGSGRLFVDASGNVGVGAAPSSRFHISTSTGLVSIFNSFDANGGYIRGQTSGSTIWDIGTSKQALNVGGSSDFGINAHNGFIALGTSSQERLRITSAGLVGVGTSSPSYLLHVSGNGAEIGLTDTAVANATWRLLASTGGSAKLFRIYDSSNAADRLVIDSSGRVGIGTSSPADILNVKTDGNTGWELGSAGTSLGSRLISYDRTAGVPKPAVIASETFSIQTSTTGGGLTSRLFVNSSGAVGIGTTAPQTLLHLVSGSSTAAYATFSGNNGSPDPFLIGQDASGLTRLFQTAAQPISFWTNSTERARIDSSGRLLVGTSTNISSLASLIQSASASTSNVFEAARFSNSAFGPRLTFCKSRGASVGTNALVADEDEIGSIYFNAANGSTYTNAARIEARVDGVPDGSFSDMPGRLVFSTTADGASSPTERLRITSAGLVGIGTASPLFPLDVNGVIYTRGRGSTFGVLFDDWRIYNSTAPGALVFDNGSERARIDSSGRLLVGTSSSLLSYSKLQVQGGAGTDPGGHLCLANENAAPSNATNIGSIRFTNNAGGIGAIVGCEADGAWTAGSNYRSRLVFSTTADGASSPTERMRIKSNGTINFSNVAVYADNAAATIGGLAVGDVYRTSTGQLMIRY